MIKATLNHAIKAYLILSLLLFCLLRSEARPPILSLDEIYSPPPKIIRTCCVFGADLSIARIPFAKKTDIVSIQDIGNHCFLGDSEENNGIIYTRKGGFIDLGHLRDYADYTAYLYSLIVTCADNGEDLFLKLGSEGGKKFLFANNLQALDSLDQFELAGKIAYDLSLWHEIATWFGNSLIPLVPERYSSFSPEDLYSNLLGIWLGIQAVKSDLEYNEAMTTLLSDALNDLNAVPNAIQTYIAMKQVEELWWSQKALPGKKVLISRYLDNDSSLIPWLVPDSDENDIAYSLHKPDPDLNQYYRFTIKLNRKFPLRSDNSNEPVRTITQNDFEWYVNYIENDLRNGDRDYDSKYKRRKNRRS